MTDQDRTAELAQTWAQELRRSGGVHTRYGTEQELAELRRAGRQAGKILDRPVRTTGRNNDFHVELTDWGTNPLEERLSDARTRNAIDQAFQPRPER